MMKCCSCGNKLAISLVLKGKGKCAGCNVEQAIGKKYTFIMAFSLIFLILFVPLIIAIKIIGIILIALAYLFFSKMEKTD